MTKLNRAAELSARAKGGKAIRSSLQSIFETLIAEYSFDQ